jgi:arsenate reductase
MFHLDAVSIAATDRTGGGLWLGEVVATLGLVLVIFGALRSGRTNTVAFAVAGYITAAYWFTSSTSFANPAVTVARMFSDTFAGIAPTSVPMFLAMQFIGGALALARSWFSTGRRTGARLVDIRGDDVTGKPTVLFVCVHNAGRSQMAAGYLQHLAGDHIEVLSAGSAPADAVNPAAVQAMGEEGIDLSAAHPKVLTDEAVQTADVVVTMGCGDACPFYPGKRYEDWKLDDPAGQGIEAVRPIRDEIRQRVERLIAELVH